VTFEIEPLADRFGRKWTLIGSAMFYSVCSLASALAPNIAILGVLRVLTGIGLQAMTVVALAFVSEMFPPHLRGRYQSLILGIGLIGIPAMSWFARGVVPLGPNGWRWVFILGGMAVVLTPLLIRRLPESARWLEAQGRPEQAAGLVERLEGEARAKTGADLPEPVAVRSAPVRGSVRELFGRGTRRATLLLSAVWVFGILGFYGFNSWVPTMMVERGFDVAHSLTFTSVLSIGAVPGALLAWLFIDRWERKYSYLAITVTVGVLILIYGLFAHVPVILVTGFLITMLLQTQTAFLYS
jgi:putative MFS transporter